VYLPETKLTRRVFKGLKGLRKKQAAVPFFCAFS